MHKIFLITTILAAAVSINISGCSNSTEETPDTTTETTITELGLNELTDDNEVFEHYINSTDFNKWFEKDGYALYNIYSLYESNSIDFNGVPYCANCGYYQGYFGKVYKYCNYDTHIEGEYTCPQCKSVTKYYAVRKTKDGSWSEEALEFMDEIEKAGE